MASRMELKACGESCVGTSSTGADVIEYCGTDGVFSKGRKVGAQQYTAEEVAALIDEAHMHGRNEIGALAPGYSADVIAVKGDPLADVRLLEQVQFVMQAGQVYKAE